MLIISITKLVAFLQSLGFLTCKTFCCTVAVIAGLPCAIWSVHDSMLNHSMKLCRKSYSNLIMVLQVHSILYTLQLSVFLYCKYPSISLNSFSSLQSQSWRDAEWSYGVASLHREWGSLEELIQCKAGVQEDCLGTELFFVLMIILDIIIQIRAVICMQLCGQLYKLP